MRLLLIFVFLTSLIVGCRPEQGSLPALPVTQQKQILFQGEDVDIQEVCDKVARDITTELTTIKDNYPELLEFDLSHCKNSRISYQYNMVKNPKTGPGKQFATIAGTNGISLAIAIQHPQEYWQIGGGPAYPKINVNIIILCRTENGKLKEHIWTIVEQCAKPLRDIEKAQR